MQLHAIVPLYMVHFHLAVYVGLKLPRMSFPPSDCFSFVLFQSVVKAFLFISSFVSQDNNKQSRHVQRPSEGLEYW